MNVPLSDVTLQSIQAAHLRSAAPGGAYDPTITHGAKIAEALLLLADVTVAIDQHVQCGPDETWSRLDLVRKLLSASALFAAWAESTDAPGATRAKIFEHTGNPAYAPVAGDDPHAPGSGYAKAREVFGDALPTVITDEMKEDATRRLAEVREAHRDATPSGGAHE